MVIGLLHGMTRADDQQQKERSYEVVRRFAEMFRRRHGSLECRELMGVDVSRPEGLAIARQRNIFRTVCPGYVRGAAEILEEILAEAMKHRG